jgi:glycosyltransferase involved in cell wall biosynthesis
LNNTFHIITGLNFGGAELMLKRLLLECSGYDNYNQTVVTLEGPGLLDNELRSNGIDVINLNISSPWNFIIGMHKLLKLMKVCKPDTVFTWMYHADLIGGLAAYLSGIKNIIWNIRCTDIPQGRISSTGFIVKLCSLFSFIIPGAIICCAHSAKSFHIRLGYCSKKMLVIPNGYDLSSFNPSQNLKTKVKKRLGLSKRSKIIGIVGRFDESKDFKNFIKSASKVALKFDDVFFFMAGKGVDRENYKLMSWINEAQINDRIVLFGQVDPHDLYAAMDFYCLSSKYEGFPNVVAEAMAMETPCIVTDVGDARTIVNNLGMVVPPNDHNQLSEAIIEMLMKPDSIKNKMAAEARQSIFENYDIKKIALEYLKLSHHGYKHIFNKDK